MTDQPKIAKKPALIAYDPTRWPDEASHQSLGVVFSHRDAKGYDVLLDAVPLTGTLTLRTPGFDEGDIPTPITGIPEQKPDYLAFVVGERKGRDGKARWRQIGAAYRHTDGNGLDVLYRTIPISGRIALRVNDQN